MTDILLIVTVVLLVATVALLLMLLRKVSQADTATLVSRLDAFEKAQERTERAVREEVAQSRDEQGNGKCNGTPMILCVSCFIFGFLRRSQTYILSGLLNSFLRDIRAESAWLFFCNMKIINHAKISKIRCPRNIAPCDGPGDIGVFAGILCSA